MKTWKAERIIKKRKSLLQSVTGTHISVFPESYVGGFAKKHPFSCDCSTCQLGRSRDSDRIRAAIRAAEEEIREAFAR